MNTRVPGAPTDLLQTGRRSELAGAGLGLVALPAVAATGMVPTLLPATMAAVAAIGAGVVALLRSRPESARNRLGLGLVVLVLAVFASIPSAPPPGWWLLAAIGIATLTAAFVSASRATTHRRLAWGLSQRARMDRNAELLREARETRGRTSP